MEREQFRIIIEKLESYLEKHGLNTNDKYDLFLLLYERAKQDKLDELEIGGEEEVEDEIEGQEFEEDDVPVISENAPQSLTKKPFANINKLEEDINEEINDELGAIKTPMVHLPTEKRTVNLVKRPKIPIRQ